MTDEFLDEISQNRIAETAEDFIKTASGPRSAMEAVVNLLFAGVPYYDWVGIYLVAKEEMLILGPYRGDPSPHERIPIGQGICGAAAREGQSIIVDDVNSDPRYLTCSVKTKSEIVVPIIKEGRVIGEIDIDSEKPAAFSDIDRTMLERIALALSEII